MKKKDASEKTGVWERTSVQCLLRNNESGIYYGWFRIHGKQKGFALDTDVFTVAKIRILDRTAEVDRLRGAVINVETGKASMANLIEVYLKRT